MPENSNHLYVQVKEYLKDMISGMKPNDKLPPRGTICRELQVARVTVDRAISELIGEGLLYALNGSGTYVSEPPQNPGNVDKTTAWGIVVPHTGMFMFPQLINGIGEIASQYGINLILCDTHDDRQKEEMHIATLIRSRVQGAIIVPSTDEDELRDKTYRSLTRAGIPFVFCNRDIRGINAHTVKSNEYHGSYLAVKHLLSHGHFPIAFVSQKRYSIVEQRFNGYAAALGEAGHEVDAQFVYMHPTLDEREAAKDAAKWLRGLSRKPAACFCFSDYLASLLYDELTRAGLRVPADIALAGVDNSVLSELLPCKLTSVDCSRYQIGCEAARELLRLTGMGNGLEKSAYTVGDLTVLPQKLVIRESCGCSIKNVQF